MKKQILIFAILSGLFLFGSTSVLIAEEIENAKGVLFGVGARMVRLEFTVLSESRELFVYSENVFEYGVSNQVIESSSQFKPFLLKNEQ